MSCLSFEYSLWRAIDVGGLCMATGRSIRVPLVIASEMSL